MQMHTPVADGGTYTTAQQFRRLDDFEQFVLVGRTQNASNQLANLKPVLRRAPHRVYTTLAEWSSMTPAQKFSLLSAEEIELRNRQMLEEVAA